MEQEKKFEVGELEASLKRAFLDGKADYVIIDGQVLQNRFLRESTQYGINKGWLERGEDIDEDNVLGQGMGQYLAYTYRLTDKGRNHFGIN